MVYKPEWLERRNVPKDIVDLLMTTSKKPFAAAF